MFNRISRAILVVALLVGIAAATGQKRVFADPPTPRGPTIFGPVPGGPHLFLHPDVLQGAVVKGGYAHHALVNLTYHGEQVAHTQTAYLIFWDPTGGVYPISAGYKTAMIQYVQDIGGSAYNGMNNQYCDNIVPGCNNFMLNSVTYGASATDTNALPHSCTGAGCATPLLDADLVAEIPVVATANSWPLPGFDASGNMTIYYFFTGTNHLRECTDGTHTACTDNAFCGYHSGNTAPYAYLPYAKDWSCHTLSTFPDGVSGAYDQTLSVLAHEQFEAATDSTNAWWDSTPGGGDEDGDKCAWTFGTNDTNTWGNNANVQGHVEADGHNIVLNGHKYLLQLDWSNARFTSKGTADSGCTDGAALATIISPTKTGITTTAATLGANITSDGGNSLLERGVVLAKTSDDPNPTIGAPNTIRLIDAQTNTGVFTDSASGLVPSTGYSYRAYAIDTAGTAYTAADTFSTTGVVISPPTIAKAFGSPTLGLGASTSLTFTIANPNVTALTNVAFTDTLPVGLVVATPNGLTGSCGGGAITATAGSGTVSLTGATLAGSAGCSFSVNVTGTIVGIKINLTSTISSTESGAGSTATATVTVTATPPSLTKAFGAASITLGSSTSLTFTLANPNVAGLTGVAFTDTLPAGLVVATPNGLTGSCGAGTITATAGSGTVTLAGGTLAGSGGCTFAVNVKGTTAGVKTNTTGTVSSTESGAGSTASATVTVTATPPSLTKAFGAASITLGSSTSLTFTLANANVANLTGVAFTDTLPAGLVVATPNGLTGSCGAGTITATAGSNTVTLAGGTLAGSGGCTFSVNVTGNTPGLKHNVTGTISSTESGAGGTATADVTVIATPPTLTKAFGSPSVTVGTNTTLTFTLTNSNAVPLTGVGFTDSLPGVTSAGGGIVLGTPVNASSPTPCGGTLTALAGGATLTLTGGTIPASGTCSFSVNVFAFRSGTVNNTTTGPTSNEAPQGVGAAATLIVNPVLGKGIVGTIPPMQAPILTKAFGANAAPFLPLNTPTSLTFTITNNNASFALTGMGFTDSLPGGMTVSTPNGLVSTCTGATVTAVAGSSTITVSGAMLASGASCTITVNVQGSTGGKYTNTTSAITSVEAGSGAPASANITVGPPIGKSIV